MTTIDLNALVLQIASERKPFHTTFMLPNKVRVECECKWENKIFEKGQWWSCTQKTLDALNIHYPGSTFPETACEQRGWQPLDPEKLERWMEAAEMVFPKVSIFKNLYTGKWHAHINQLKGYECSKGNTPSEAFFLGLSNAVQILSEEK